MQIREGLQYRISTKSVEGLVERVNNSDHGSFIMDQYDLKP
jgi:hypothetical protein